MEVKKDSPTAVPTYRVLTELSQQSLTTRTKFANRQRFSAPKSVRCFARYQASHDCGNESKWLRVRPVRQGVRSA